MPQQRDTIRTLSPPWLQDGNAEKFLYTFGLSLDLLLEKAKQAQTAHMPGLSDPSAIPFQALDKGLVQGPAETNVQFSARLAAALDSWAHAGSRRAVLEQVQAFLTGTQPGVATSMPEGLIVGGNSSVSTWDETFFSTPQGAAPAHSLVSPANWNWDGQSRPWRAWLVLFMAKVATGQFGSTATISSTGGSGVTGVTSGFATLTGMSGMTADNVQNYVTISGASTGANNGTFQIVAVPSATSVIYANPNAVSPDASGANISWDIFSYPFLAPAPVFGSPQFVWGPGWSWGVSLRGTAAADAIVTSIRQIVQKWKSASAYYPHIIVSFGGGDGTSGNEFSPLSSQGSGNPDGTWGGYGRNVNGVWVPSKQPLNSFTSFADGTGSYYQCTEQNVG